MAQILTYNDGSTTKVLTVQDSSTGTTVTKALVADTLTGQMFRATRVATNVTSYSVEYDSDLTAQPKYIIVVHGTYQNAVSLTLGSDDSMKGATHTWGPFGGIVSFTPGFGNGVAPTVGATQSFSLESWIAINGSSYYDGDNLVSGAYLRSSVTTTTIGSYTGTGYITGTVFDVYQVINPS